MEIWAIAFWGEDAIAKRCCQAQIALLVILDKLVLPNYITLGKNTLLKLFRNS
jgi:hypothetical protein